MHSCCKLYIQQNFDNNCLIFLHVSGYFFSKFCLWLFFYNLNSELQHPKLSVTAQSVIQIVQHNNFKEILFSTFSQKSQFRLTAYSIFISLLICFTRSEEYKLMRMQKLMFLQHKVCFLQGLFPSSLNFYHDIPHTFAAKFSSSSVIIYRRSLGRNYLCSVTAAVAVSSVMAGAYSVFNTYLLNKFTKPSNSFL